MVVRKSRSSQIWIRSGHTVQRVPSQYQPARRVGTDRRDFEREGLAIRLYQREACSSVRLGDSQAPEHFYEPHESGASGVEAGSVFKGNVCRHRRLELLRCRGADLHHVSAEGLAVIWGRGQDSQSVRIPVQRDGITMEGAFPL